MWLLVLQADSEASIIMSTLERLLTCESVNSEYRSTSTSKGQIEREIVLKGNKEGPEHRKDPGEK